MLMPNIGLASEILGFVLGAIETRLHLSLELDKLRTMRIISLSVSDDGTAVVKLQDNGDKSIIIITLPRGYNACARCNITSFTEDEEV